MDEKKEKYNYEYDGNERLNCIKDNDQKIVQSFTYNHTSQSIQDIYLNNSLTISASKQCPEGYTSSPAYIHYPVEEGLIFSSISQEDADNKARLKFQDEAVRLADEQYMISSLFLVIIPEVDMTYIHLVAIMNKKKYIFNILHYHG